MTVLEPAGISAGPRGRHAADIDTAPMSDEPSARLVASPGIHRVRSRRRELFEHLSAIFLV
jgi:hypothetical protein